MNNLDSWLERNKEFAAQQSAAGTLMPSHVAFLRTIPALPGAWLVSGLVYDVATGRVEIVVAPAPIRDSSSPTQTAVGEIRRIA